MKAARMPWMRDSTALCAVRSVCAVTDSNNTCIRAGAPRGMRPCCPCSGVRVGGFAVHRAGRSAVDEGVEVDSRRDLAAVCNQAGLLGGIGLGRLDLLHLADCPVSLAEAVP